jgi:hypothetical protein
VLFSGRSAAHNELCDDFGDDPWTQQICARRSLEPSLNKAAVAGPRGLRKIHAMYDAEGWLTEAGTGDRVTHSADVGFEAYLLTDELEAYNNTGLLCMDPLELHLRRPRFCCHAVVVKQAGHASEPPNRWNIRLDLRTHERLSQQSSLSLHDWMPPLRVSIPPGQSVSHELERVREELSVGSAFSGLSGADKSLALEDALASLNRSLHRASLVRNRPILDVLRCRRAEQGQVLSTTTARHCLFPERIRSAAS